MAEKRLYVSGANYTKEELERNRKFGDVTSNGVVFDWELAGPNGARFLLFREPFHSDDDLHKAVKQIQIDRDVVGLVKVANPAL